MKKLKLLAIAILFIAGCAKDLGYKNAVQGSWQGVNWTVENAGNREAGNVKFTFSEQGYQAVLGGRQEQGTYRINGDKLYTQAEGQQEIMVRIARLANDTLEFEMNRGGTKEHLTLSRE